MEENGLNELMSLSHPLKSKDVMTIAMSRYNTPLFTEYQMSDWIAYGYDNLYPQYLIECLDKSSTHKAIVEAKVKEIIGNGLSTIESEDKDQLALVANFLKKTSKYESMNDVLRKIIYDYVVFGGLSLEIIWSHDRTKIAEVHHIDFSTLRVQKPNEESCESEGFYFSENWAQYKKPRFKPRFMAKFSTENRIDPSSVLYVKPYSPNTLYYPKPEYISASNYIEMDYETSNYQLNSLKNGLSPSLMIQFNQGPATLEQRQALYHEIKHNFTGTDNAGKFMLFFNDSKDTSAEVTPIQLNELDKLYTVLNQNIVQNIMTAHRVTSPALLGIPGPGTLGTSQELIYASQLFYAKVIRPDQLVIEETINKILEVNKWSLEVKLTDSQPIEFTVSEATMLQVMTKDEIRAKLKLDPLTPEQNAELIASNSKGGFQATAAPKTAAMDAAGQPIESAVTNDNIKNMTAKQHQQMLRIIRQVSKGQLTREAGIVLLSTGLGLSPEDIDALLPTTEEDMENDVTSLKPYVKEVDKKKTNTSK